MQAFLEKQQLEHVVGVELTHARYLIAARALKNLAARNPGKYGCREESCTNGRRKQWLRLVEGHRILAYENFGLENSYRWEPPPPRVFHQLACNKDGECYPVRWEPKSGHHFFLHEVEAFAKNAKLSFPRI